MSARTGRDGSRRGPRVRQGARERIDPARRVAFDALRAVHADDGYANLVLADLLRTRHLGPVDAGFATELLHGTCRGQGTYDRIIEAAAGRPLGTLQPAVVDVLRLGTHQLLAMDVPAHAAVATSVELGRSAIGERVAGVLNAVLRRVDAHDRDGWLAELTRGRSAQESLVLTTSHPAWVVAAYTDRLGPEAEAALQANNVPARPTLVRRPGLCEEDELARAGAERTGLSPFGWSWRGDPGDLAAVRDGRVGVQDEGSQLVALALARAAGPEGPWLDLCAGPGGKTALLGALAAGQDQQVVAAERAHHRSRLVVGAVRSLPRPVPVVTADGTRPAWRPGTFARVLADVPCTGLGALRRRPESRWRRTEGDLTELHELQVRLLGTALDSTAPGGVTAYVTCSPHPVETTGVVAEVLSGREDVTVEPAAPLLPEVGDVAVPGPGAEGFVQLWPHRHGTDAMFLALLRRR